MTKGRLEAFTDGVIAIIITIMVLELKVPQAADLAALQATAPVFFAYVLSYVNVAIFWNNHHHMLHLTERVDGRVLWANLFFLFWLSLVPFVIRWMDETGITAFPTAAYGVVLAMSAIGYTLLQAAIVACNGGRASKLAAAIGGDIKGKLSLTLYVLAVPLAFVNPWIAIAIYVVVALIWFVPDPRIEKGMTA
jgi:TMEM175 potassium channel family protein